MHSSRSNGAAVVVVDVQNSQVGRDLGPYSVDDVAARSQQLVDAGRAAGALIVWVRSSHLPGGGDEIRADADTKPTRSGPRPDGWDQLLPRFDPQPHEPVTIKRGWDAFYGSDLDLQLRRHGVDTLFMAGISTNFGVEGTARAAVDRSYRLVFATDAMTAATSESHEYSISTVFPRIGRVMSTEQAAAELRAMTPVDAGFGSD